MISVDMLDPKLLLIMAVPLLLFATHAAVAESDDLGDGFRHHGVATPVSNHRGTTVAVDGDGRNVVLVWLYDHRGGYAILMIDAETGEAEQFGTPYNWRGDGPFASILSSRNRYYTHFGSHFTEFDPEKREFTFVGKTVPQMAMSMTEDDNGVIWSSTYPNSAVASYNPETGEFRDYGNLYDQSWRQYPRYMAADDAGWIYFSIGSTSGQIIILDPVSGEARPVVPEDERTQGAGYVYRDMDGKVYGQGTGGKDNPWYELYAGQARKLNTPPEKNPKPIIAGTQGLYHRDFPDGARLGSVDLINRVMTVTDAGADAPRTVPFDYVSEGAHVMGLCTAPNGTISGGTAFPMRFFSYSPTADEWVRHTALSQWNTVTALGDRYFVGGYGHGIMLEWDPSREWVDTVKGNPDCNPLFLAECPPTINRPHDLLAHPDGKLVILAGTPGYGYTGGGLMIWDREAKTKTVIEHTEIIPDQSTMALLDLPDGKLLGGTTIAAGTGGQVKASLAELYIMDLATGAIEWHEPLIADARNYTTLCHAPDGLVYGVVDNDQFFVLDPAKREIVHQQALEAEFGRTNGQQGPRVFINAPDGAIYMLFRKGIAQINTETHEITMLIESPLPIGPGGDILDGRIYFASGSHLYSWEIPTEE